MDVMEEPQHRQAATDHVVPLEGKRLLLIPLAWTDAHPVCDSLFWCRWESQSLYPGPPALLAVNLQNNKTTLVGKPPCMIWRAPSRLQKLSFVV